MIYLIFLFFSCLYLYNLHRYRALSHRQLYIYFLPVILFWVLLIGGQYNVGTDYFAYMNIFNGNLYYIAEHRGEFVFAALVRLCNTIGIYGQGIFFVLSFIWIILLIKIISYIIDSRHLYIFFFVFIVFTGIFHNQMNEIRQYSAVYLFTLSVCSFFAKKYKTAILLTFLMIFIHLSSIMAVIVFAIGLLFLNSLVQHPKYLYYIVLISLILSLTISEATIGNLLSHFSNINMVDAYSSAYVNTGRIVQTGFASAVTKYVYIPLILYAIHTFSKMDLSVNEKKLFVVGICGYCFKLAIVSVAIIYRLGQYFDILMCIPLTYMLIHLSAKKKKRTYYAFMAYLLLPYALKVTVLAVGEYQYHSIFLH